MKYWYQPPCELISEYLRTVLILEGSSKPSSSASPLVTNGMQVLLCSTEKASAGVERVTRLTLFGKSIPQECWEIGSRKTTIAFFFMPFAMAGFFNIPAGKLMEGPVDLHNWIPHTANAVRTQLMYADSTAQKVEVLEHFLIHQFQENRRVCEIVRSATDEMMCDPNTMIISELLKKLNLKERTFQRIFKKHVGIPPNQYRRICQFQLSFAQVRAGKFNTLTDVAFDNGFADQSHFIRSFKEFVDTTPNHYLRSGLKEKA